MVFAKRGLLYATYTTTGPTRAYTPQQSYRTVLPNALHAGHVPNALDDYLITT